MKKLIRIVRQVFTAPLALMLGVLEDSDYEELTRAVDKRLARAESAVLRDYFAQHGLEGEESELAQEEYRARRKSARPDNGLVDELRQRAELAEQQAAQAMTNAEAMVYMARMGVPESCTQDIGILVSAQLEGSEDRSREAVCQAVDAVLARLPGIAERPVSSGQRGNFPRRDDGAAVWRSQLERARASGDNAAAVRIIAAAAEKGVVLR